MTLRSSCLVLSVLLALTACDSDTEGTSDGGGTTSDGDESGTSGNTPTGVTVTATATTPTTVTATMTEGSTTDSTDGSTTDSTDGDTGSSSGEFSTGSSSGEAGSSSGGSSSTGGEAGVTIYDVQDGTIGEDQTVAIEGVVITGLRIGVGVFVQEIDGGEYSGVYVDTGDIDLSAFSIGDVVNVSGTVTEDLPANNPAALVNLTGIISGDGSGTMVATGETTEIAPEVVELSVLSNAEMAEPWEGVLVTVAGNLSATTAMNNAMSEFGDFSEFAVQQGADSVRVDDFLYNIFNDEESFPGFGVGASFDAVTGVLNFSFGNFKIAPRSAAEFEGYAAPG